MQCTEPDEIKSCIELAVDVPLGGFRAHRLSSGVSGARVFVERVKGLRDLFQLVVSRTGLVFNAWFPLVIETAGYTGTRCDATLSRAKWHYEHHTMECSGISNEVAIPLSDALDRDDRAHTYRKQIEVLCGDRIVHREVTAAVDHCVSQFRQRILDLPSEVG